MWLVTIFHLHWICNLNLCYSLNFPQYFIRSILWSKHNMWSWRFLNFSYVSSCNLPQTFLGNNLGEFPGCSSGWCKADIFCSWGVPDDVICILEAAWTKPVQELVLFLRMFWGGSCAIWDTSRSFFLILIFGLKWITLNPNTFFLNIQSSKTLLQYNNMKLYLSEFFEFFNTKLFY